MKPQIQSNVQTKLMTIAMVLLAIEQCKANNSPYCIIDMQALEAASSTSDINPKQLFSSTTTSINCMHLKTVAALQEVHQELQERDLALKVLRSPQAPHAQQQACDCGIVDVTLMTQDGYELLMPSDYNSYTLASDKPAQKNHELLRTAMMRHGFEPGAHWWQYTLKVA